MAMDAGASALGLVSAMPSGPGVISEEAIRAIAVRVPPPVASFLLTALTDASLLIALARYCACTTLQLCDRTTAETRRRIRRQAPDLRIVQVVHVTGAESLKEAREAEQGSDALLLDSGRFDAPVKELGGTGRAHDWAVSARIARAAKVPVFLAGGLSAGNARQAVERVRPFALDVCSGLRTAGRLDAHQLRQFAEAIRGPLP